NLGVIHDLSGEIDSAIYYYQKSLYLSLSLDYNKGIGYAYENLGNLYMNIRQFKEAKSFLLKAYAAKLKVGNQSDIATTLYTLARTSKGLGENEKAIEYYKHSLSIRLKLKDYSEAATIYNNMAVMYELEGEIKNAIELHNQSLRLKKQAGDLLGVATSYNNLGTLYKDIGDIPKAMECYKWSLDLYEQINDKKGKATTFTNIGGIYKTQGDIEKALEYFRQSLNINIEIGNKAHIAIEYYNIGSIYKTKGNFSKALDYYNDALQLWESLNDQSGIASAYNNIGVIFDSNKEYDKALDYYTKSNTIQSEIKDSRGFANSINNIGNVYYKLKDFSKALKCGIEADKVTTKLGYPEDIRDSKLLLFQSYKKLGRHNEALKAYEDYVKMKDSIVNRDNQKLIIKQQTQYEYDKQKALDDKAHDYELKQKEEQAAAEKNKQNIIIASVSLVLLIVAVFSGFLYNRFKVTQKQKLVIEHKEKETNEQKVIIEEKHKEITDSINYAERIQRSFLATKELLDENLVSSSLPIVIGNNSTKDGITRTDSEDSYFILFKPKDIVSGDFYWASKLNNGNFAFVTADSTGHGVPGAIMSLLNITSIEKAIESETSPDRILNKTRSIIIERLKKDGSLEGGKDGMDCSFLSFNQDKTKLQIASANNPVWIMRKKPDTVTPRHDVEVSDSSNNVVSTGSTTEVIEIKPDKMPVGKHDKQDTPFTLKEIDLQRGDVIYSLTDGFPDQFGGPRGKKFMSKKLRELLKSISQKPMKEQKQILEETFTSWVGDIEQIDDVCIVGVRV
ncbi:MAG: tetratricopeptide repeat protein, partial [Flavobacteriales bacterium]|nr:tetratricopeptide repeat protein [Flavobacteriales bacterium]